MKLKKLSAFAMMALLATPLLTACTDDENTGLGNLVDGEDQFGKANDVPTRQVILPVLLLWGSSLAVTE